MDQEYLKEENYYKLREILNNKKFKYYDKSLNDIDKTLASENTYQGKKYSTSI